MSKSELYLELRDKLLLSRNKSGLSFIPYLSYKVLLRELFEDGKIVFKDGINCKLIFLS